VLAYRLGFAAIGDLLAQLGEYGADPRLAEFRRRAQRVLQFLAGMKRLTAPRKKRRSRSWRARNALREARSRSRRPIAMVYGFQVPFATAGTN